MLKNLRFKNVLVLSAHTDDETIACGGTIHKLTRNGSQVTVIPFCWRIRDELKEEFLKSASVLGFTPHILETNYPERILSDYRHQIRDFLYHLNQKEEFDLVIIPTSADKRHQDHKVLYEEGMRIFGDTTVWGWIVMRNCRYPKFQRFIKLESQDYEAKMKAICYYESQFKLRPHQFDMELQKAYLRVWGSYINTKFAEAFESISEVE